MARPLQAVPARSDTSVMKPDVDDQPSLPFEPPLRPGVPAREVSEGGAELPGEMFAARLFEEFIRRAARRDQKSTAA